MSHAYFDVWHFIYQQVQLDNWFGNVVAGVSSSPNGKKSQEAESNFARPAIKKSLK